VLLWRGRVGGVTGKEARVRIEGLWRRVLEVEERF
jgi:hypothetical protein